MPAKRRNMTMDTYQLVVRETSTNDGIDGHKSLHDL
jgi:hypothetical protein